MGMVRFVVALGAFGWLLSGAMASAQLTGSWHPSRPKSKTIVYDEKGRRLYFDDNGQIVGRYSFATGRYVAESPGLQRDETIEPARQSPGESQRELAIIFWGRGRENYGNRSRPKIITGPTISPVVVRHGTLPLPAGDVAEARKVQDRSTVSFDEPEMMPYASFD